MALRPPITNNKEKKMEFKMPEAKRERLEELLEYLGERAEDFRKCFDVESEWCWKYADLALRGIERRDLEYAEGHHIVPRSFYGIRYTCRRVDEGNICTLAYSEHVLAHYCAAHCGIGNIQGKMARSLITMYNVGMKNKVQLMPTEKELIEAIPELELKRIFAMWPLYAKVEAEGRTHMSEDPVQAGKDYRMANRERLNLAHKKYYQENKEVCTERQKAWRDANKEKIGERSKAYYRANRERISEYQKDYRNINKDKLSEYQKARYAANRERYAELGKTYYESNRERILERVKVYREANKEKIAERMKAYYATNRESILERAKTYREANKEKIAERSKTWREANKEKIAERDKAYCEANREKITEYRKAYYANNRESTLERVKTWREANKEKIAKYNKAYSEAKKAAGYRYRKDPTTGKYGWVFVGLPEAKEVA